jgi:hypothetical protein
MNARFGSMSSPSYVRSPFADRIEGHRSDDCGSGTANLAVWVWVERHETDELTGIIGAWMVSSTAAEQVSALVHDQPGGCEAGGVCHIKQLKAILALSSACPSR